MAAVPHFEMPTLLERAGFHVRGTRADCRNCEGGSRLTVAIYAERAKCFRCDWYIYRRQLLKQLGLLPTDPESRRRFAAEQRKRQRRERIAQQFETWRNGQIRQLTDEYRALFSKAALAHSVLPRFPDCEPAWDALARCYHNEARLSRWLDYLTCAKATPWLDRDYTIEEVFSFWADRKQAA